MKVLLLGRSSNAGGGPVWGRTLARGLSARGHLVRIVFTRIGARSNFMHQQAADEGFVVESLCYLYRDPSYPREVADFIESWYPDVMVIDNQERLPEVWNHSPRLQSRQTRVVFIAHCNMVPSAYLKEIQPYLSKVVCVSERAANGLRQFDPIVIRNAVYPPPGNGEDVRAKLNTPPEAFVIGYVGRWDDNKRGRRERDGEPIFFDAVRGNEWHLLLAGKDAPAPSAGEGAELRDRCYVYPFEVANIADWYGALDVFVLTSREEGFPLCVSEAILCGCRVACTRVSDLEAIFGESIGFFGYGDVEGLRSAIHTAPPPEKAQRIIAEKLSVETMLDAYEEVFGLGKAPSHTG